MFLIVQAEPVHSVVVLRVSHDGVDVIGLLNGEFDDHAWSMNPIVEGAAKIAGRTAPQKVQLVEASPLIASRCRSAASTSALRTYSSTNANSNFFWGASSSLAGSPSNRLRLLRRPTPVSTPEKSGSADRTATLACCGWSEPTRSRPRSPS